MYKKKKQIYFFIFLIAFSLCDVIFSKEIENLHFIGTIIAIRNEKFYTAKLEKISKEEYKILRSENPILYSLNASSEISHCFKILHGYHYHKKHYLHLLEMPCKYKNLYPKIIEVGDKLYIQRETIKKTSSNNKLFPQNIKEKYPKIIIHPIDKKEMIYVPEDYLLYGQGIDPEDSSFNIFYYNWNLETVPKINAFYIDKYEVTNKEFLIFCLQTDYKCPEFLKSLKKEDWNKPFIYATYNDVKAYANWAKKEIPTEWEWELAAKGGFKEFLQKSKMYDKSIFPEFPSSIEHCNTLEHWEKEPEVIDVYKLKDINFRGIVGLCGNALEWTSSYFLPYPGHRFSKIEHQHLAGKFYRVLRGGAFYLPLEKAKVYKRIVGGNPDFKNDPIGGFRLILRTK
ncbi:MAG: hypothetical protein KatS3mg129_0964 [Leptospiraceae bacterium]|nr:MAG: hypothetical protein KatS3mg129_0964 [Leptospiraceae bacterium]